MFEYLHFMKQFSINAFISYQNGINISTYRDFLRGSYWDDRLLEVDYDNVTASLDDSLLGVKMMLHQDSTLRYLYSHKETEFPDEKWSLKFVPDFRVSLRLWNKKCFSFGLTVSTWY